MSQSLPEDAPEWAQSPSVMTPGGATQSVDLRPTYGPEYAPDMYTRFYEHTLKVPTEVVNQFRGCYPFQLVLLAQSISILMAVFSMTSGIGV